MGRRSPLAKGGLGIRVFLLAEGNIGHADEGIVEVGLALRFVVGGGVELVRHGGRERGLAMAGGTEAV